MSDRTHLDFLLWGQSDVNCDEVFEQSRTKVLSFIQECKRNSGSEFVEPVPRVLPVEIGGEGLAMSSGDNDDDIPMVDESLSFSQAVVDEFPSWIGTPHLGDASSFTIVTAEPNMSAQVSLSEPTKACVGHVIAAEVGLNPTSGYLSMIDCITQQEVPHDQLVAGRSLFLHEEQGLWTETDEGLGWDGYGDPRDQSFEEVRTEISPTVSLPG